MHLWFALYRHRQFLVLTITTATKNLQSRIASIKPICGFLSKAYSSKGYQWVTHNSVQFDSVLRRTAFVPHNRQYVFTLCSHYTVLDFTKTQWFKMRWLISSHDSDHRYISHCTKSKYFTVHTIFCRGYSTFQKTDTIPAFALKYEALPKLKAEGEGNYLYCFI